MIQSIVSVMFLGAIVMEFINFFYIGYSIHIITIVDWSIIVISFIILGCFGEGKPTKRGHKEGVKELMTGETYKQKEYVMNPKKMNQGEFAYSLFTKNKIWNEVDKKIMNYMMGVFGTTGSGKTTSMSWLYQDTALRYKNSPIIIIDAKPDYEKISEYKRLCDETGRIFYGFNCANKLSYDFLNNGSPTEIKDKIISLKNRNDWDSDYYKTQAESYLQNAIYILKEVKTVITLNDVIDSLDMSTFIDMIPSELSANSRRRLKRIENIDGKDLKGISNQLCLLADSDFGDWLSTGHDNEFTLNEAIEKNGFVYFALPSMKYPTFTRLLGYLIISDFKTVLEERKENGKIKDIYCFFDEFSAFAGEQVVNILNQGRGLGVHCVVGTQTLADIETVGGKTLVSQILGNLNSMLIHTIADHDTAQYLADKIGHTDRTKYQKVLTEDGKSNESGATVSFEKANILTTQEMKELMQGTAFITTTVFKALEIDKIQISYYDNYYNTIQNIKK